MLLWERIQRICEFHWKLIILRAKRMSNLSSRSKHISKYLSNHITKHQQEICAGSHFVKQQTIFFLEQIVFVLVIYLFFQFTLIYYPFRVLGLSPMRKGIKGKLREQGGYFEGFSFPGLCWVSVCSRPSQILFLSECQDL